MDLTELFLKFVLVLLTAKAMAELFARFSAPPVIGEVVAGILIGPSLLGLIGPGPVFHTLAQIGVLFLLFEVGMDTDVGKLVSVGGQSLLVALTGVVLPLALGYAAARYMFGMPSLTSMYVGGTLVATSIGITLRVFKDMGASRTHEAQVVLGAAVLDDVIGVVILAMLVQYTASGAVEFGPSLRTLGFMAVFLVAAPALSSLVIRFIGWLKGISMTPGVVSITVVGFMLLMSVLARQVGAPEIIGAFAAGLALTGKASPGTLGKAGRAGERVAEAARERTAPIGALFIPVFFVMVGVSINFREIDFGSAHFWLFAGSMLLVAFVAKVVSGVWVRGPFMRKLTVGVAMAPRGEVGLIFAGMGLVAGVFGDAAYASMVFVVALTTLVAPFVLKALATSSPRQ